ncbi:hypothetical protein YB2330_006656 [Saitoella coloradoensis]
MSRHLFLLAALVAFLGQAVAGVLPWERKHATSSSFCENTPSSRSCWGNYSIYTDYYSVEESPSTGVVREYWLDVVNTTLAPDGVPRQVLVFNGTFPGPMIWANWGDEIVVHINNCLENNGTAIHWHAQTQLNNNNMDGVPGVTQAPIPPGGNYTYRFKADHYGQSWYHSHFSMQYVEGLAGPLTIYGPTSSNYDCDLGPLTFTDWRHESAFKVIREVANGGFALVALESADTLLLNGTNVYNNTGNITGSYLEVDVVPNTKYKMSLIGALGENSVYFSIDNHNITIVSTDFTPIEPIVVDHIFVTPGQRYEIIFETNQDVDNYWIRAVPAVIGGCAFNTNYMTTGRGILRYAGAPVAEPVTTAWNIQETCLDLPGSQLQPILYKEVPIDLDADFLYGMIVGHWNTSGPGRSELFYINKNEPANSTTTSPSDAPAYIDPLTITPVSNTTLPGEASMLIDFSNSSLGIVENHAWFGTPLDFPASHNVYPLYQRDEWVYFVIEAPGGIAHPMHLHGHDFYILSESGSQFNKETASISGTNPVRRDTAMCPPFGHMLLAWKSDNPGCWMLHCHIAWHIALGLGLQFLEIPDDIPSSLNITPFGDDPWYQNSLAWDAYDSPPLIVPEDDSGL